MEFMFILYVNECEWGSIVKLSWPMPGKSVASTWTRIKLIVNSGQVATHLQFKGKLIVEQKYVQAGVSGCVRCVVVKYSSWSAHTHSPLDTRYFMLGQVK